MKVAYIIELCTVCQFSYKDNFLKANKITQQIKEVTTYVLSPRPICWKGQAIRVHLFRQVCRCGKIEVLSTIYFYFFILFFCCQLLVLK